MVPSNGSSGIAQLQRINIATTALPTNTVPSISSSTPSAPQVVITNGGHHTTLPTLNTSLPGNSISDPNAGIDLVGDQNELNGPTDDNQLLEEAETLGDAEDGENEGDEEEEPLYVNAKQYNRILKRRIARAKLESEGRIPKIRQVCFF